MWFIGVEVEQETSAPPPEKNPGSAPVGGPLECVTEAKNVNVSCNFDLRLYVIAKRGNGSKEIACR